MEWNALGWGAGCAARTAAIGVAVIVGALPILGSIVNGPAMAMPAEVKDSCAGAGSNVEYKVCLQKRYEVADRELNRIYKEVRSQVKGEQSKILTDAQVAWIQYRDKTCDFETFASRQGSGYRGFLNECRERMTKARSAELQAYFQSR